MRKLKLEELGRKSVEEFKAAPKINVRVLLDNVRSMNNVGSAFRTSDAFLIDKLYLCGITATPPHRDIRKSALGAEESMDWEYANDPLDVIRSLKSEGYTILSVEQATDSSSLDGFEVNPDQKYLLVFGNEVKGVDDLVIQQSDGCLEIPQFGSKHSLNISVSIGIVLWKFAQAFHR